mmetsp:Transcript_54669/g.116817  ORF Transcript_54669/g.116817 Transcript_54669/m.116817 type:complete len:256 (-) Transcript_54669:6-773(-)
MVVEARRLIMISSQRTTSKMSGHIAVPEMQRYSLVGARTTLRVELRDDLGQHVGLQKVPSLCDGRSAAVEEEKQTRVPVVRSCLEVALALPMRSQLQRVFPPKHPVLQPVSRKSDNPPTRGLGHLDGDQNLPESVSKSSHPPINTHARRVVGLAGLQESLQGQRHGPRCCCRMGGVARARDQGGFPRSWQGQAGRIRRFLGLFWTGLCRSQAVGICAKVLVLVLGVLGVLGLSLTKSEQRGRVHCFRNADLLEVQ